MSAVNLNLNLKPQPEITRRDFGRGLAAILAAGVAPSIIAGGLRRGLGAKLASMGNREYTASDYKGTFLAHWDGIENNGLNNPHDPNATVWKDLSNNGYDWTILTATWYDDGLNVSLNSAILTNLLNENDIKAIEVSTEAPTEEHVFVVKLSRNKIVAIKNDVNGGYQFTPSGSNCIAKGDTTTGRTTGCCIYNPFTMFFNGKTTTIGGWTSWGNGYDGKLSGYGGNYYFIGKVRFIRVHATNPSASEILHNYNIDKIRYNLV